MPVENVIGLIALVAVNIYALLMAWSCLKQAFQKSIYDRKEEES